MGTGRSRSVDDESAADYDLQRERYGWYGPEILFGLMFEYVKPGETLLDLGIGTGLAAILFHKAGMRVAGLDASAEMLKACARKGFAVKLVQHDLQDVPLPYGDGSFDHIISAGVLNFVEALEPILMEMDRILKPGGMLGFTVEEQKDGWNGAYVMIQDRIADMSEAEAGVRLYRHSREYVCALLGQSSFSPLRELEFLASTYPQGAGGPNIFLKAYVAQKVGFGR